MYLYSTLMKFTMKAAFVKDSSSVVVEDVEKPILGTGDVLVKMHACGICGSDLEKVFGKYSQPSTRLGHEPSGTIEKVGENITDFKKGDRVFVHHHVPCYSCHFCLHGNETMCEKYSETNLSPCGLAEEFIVPQWNVNHGGILKIPDSMSFEEAAMIEPLACCIRAWDKFSFQKGDSTAIFGVGATGSLQALSSAIDLVRKGGTVVMFGVPSKGAMINLNMSIIYSKEITMISSYAASDSDTNAALELIQSSKIDVKKLITHRYNIKDSPKAFEH